MPNHTLQILRLLRFAGLMLLLGSAAPASAQTVKERMKKDPGFRIYPVIFGVTATSDSTPPVVRVVEVGTPPNERTKSGDAPKIDIPDAWIKAAKKKIKRRTHTLNPSKRLDIGKGHVRFKKLDDLALDLGRPHHARDAAEGR